MLFTLAAYSQTANLNLAIKFQISNPGSTGTFPTFTVAGNVNDDMGRWDATNIQVGDSLYVLNGGQDLAICRVATINSAISNALNVTVTCVTAGVTSLDPGQAAIIRPTGINRLPTYISGLQGPLQSLILNRQSQIIDRINIDITSYIGISGVAPAVAASSYTGEVWKNSVGELYSSNGVIWTMAGVAYTAGNGIGITGNQIDNTLITGVSGGQIITSDVDAGGDLVIQGTSNATTAGSNVIIQPVGGFVGINTGDPRAALSVQGTIMSGQYNVGQNDVNRNTGFTTAVLGGTTNRAFSWSNAGFGTSNWLDGKISMAFGNVNIASGNDAVAFGNRTVVGRRQYALTYAPGVTDQGANTSHGVTALAGQTRAFVTLPAEFGDVRGYFPSAQMFVTNPSFVTGIYGAGATVDALGNVYASGHSAPGDLTWALHPFMMIRDSVSEVGIRQFRILNALFSGGRTTIYYDTTASVYNTIGWVYSSTAPTVRINGEQIGNGQMSSGILTAAAGYGAAAFGLETKAYGQQSFAGGITSQALGQGAVAMGIGTISNPSGSAAFGLYNASSGTPGSTSDTDIIFAVGVGTSNTTRATSLAIQKNGVGYHNYNFGVGGPPVNRFSVARGLNTLTIEPEAFSSPTRLLIKPYTTSTGVPVSTMFQTSQMFIGRIPLLLGDTTVKLNVQGVVRAFDPVKSSAFSFGITSAVSSGYNVNLGQDDIGAYVTNNSSGRGFYWNNNNDTSRLVTFAANGNVAIGKGKSAPTAPTPTARLEVISNDIGVTMSSLQGLALTNRTPATAALNQNSPPIRWRGEGWRTAAGGINQVVDFRAYVIPITGTSAPTAIWNLGRSINVNAYVENLLTVHTDGNVGIGTGTALVKLDINGTDAIRFPVGTTAQRPASPAVGMLRYNNTIPQYETYNGSAWTGLLTTASGGLNGIYGGSGTVFANAVATIASTDSLSFSGVEVTGGKAMVNIIATGASNEPDFLRFREAAAFLNISRGDSEFILNTNQPLVISTSNSTDNDINISSSDDITLTAVTGSSFITSDGLTQLTHDSLRIIGMPTRTTGAAIMMHNGNNTATRLVGTSGGDILKWNGTSWFAGANIVSVPISSLTSATSTDSINNLNYAQVWNWTTADNERGLTLKGDSITTGDVLLVTGNLNASSAGGSLMTIVNTSNSSPVGSVFTIKSSAVETSPVFDVFPSGKIGINTGTPTAKLDISAELSNRITGLLGLNLRDEAGLHYGARISGGTTSSANRFLIMNTNSDSLRFQESGGDYTMQAFGSDLFIATSDILDLGGDSLHYTESMIESKTAFPFLTGVTTGSHAKKIAGAYDGDFLSYVNGSWRQSSNIRMSKLRFTDTHNITGTGTVTASSTISDNVYDVGDAASLTMQLPASPTNNQICTITFFDVITALTYSGNGNTIYPTGAAPTTTVLGTSTTFKFMTGKGWIIQ